MYCPGGFKNVPLGLFSDTFCVRFVYICVLIAVCTYRNEPSVITKLRRMPNQIPPHSRAIYSAKNGPHGPAGFGPAKARSYLSDLTNIIFEI